jgi:ATP-binding cassette subfamily F protein uup
MALLAVHDLSKTHASRTLFDRLTLTFHSGERVGLIGPNGAGKTTLLRILAGVDTADSGSVERAREARIAYLPQIDIFPDDATVEGALLSALQNIPMEDYERTTRARKMLRRLGFEDGGASVDTLSGGWRKRLAIGCHLVQEPALLLMDEPTNHLDLQGIDWLERFLERASFSFILTSHDRYFLERVTDRIVEINPRYRDGSYSVRGHYSDFIEKREAFLHSQDNERLALANEVRREVEWLRRGPKARSSKASYLIDKAHRKIEELAEAKRRYHGDGDLSINFNASGRRTHDLIIARGIEKTLGGRTLFRDLDVHLCRGTRLGIAGNNASGKTTLLHMLAARIPPDAGIVKHALDLRIAVFDQQREQINEAESLRRALAPSGDTVSYLGRSSHVVAWAKRFGFHADQLETPVGELSGGEQARVLMAMMIQQPADVLLLDEPTNDLDIQSVEVLENALIDFPGAVVLITHDRHMLDRVCTDLIGLHGNGRCGNYASVAQWQEADRQKAKPSSTASQPKKRQAVARLKQAGMSYHEKREWAGMEERIFAAEEEVARLQRELDNPAVATDHEKLQSTYEAHRAAQQEVDALYARWEELERKMLNS